MDAAWFAPPAVLVLAVLGVAALLRRIGAALDDLGGATERARRIDGALIPVRVETRRARTSIDRFHRR